MSSSDKLTSLSQNPYDFASRKPTPSFPNGASSQASKPSGVLSKAAKRAILPKPPSAFLLHPVYRIALPEPPADLKCLEVELDCSTYAKCTVSDLEREYRPPLLSDPFHGIYMNLIDQELYRTHSKDDTLTAEDDDLLGGQKGVGSRFSDKADAKPGGRKAPKHLSIPWLRRMTYEEYRTSSRATIPRATPGSRKRKFEPKTREEQLRAIEQSFAAAKRAPVHPTKKHLKPVNIAPLVPDFAAIGNNYMLVRFDAPPLARHTIYNRDAEKEKEAMDTAFTIAHIATSTSPNSQTSKIFKYYLPTEETLRKRKSRDEEGIKGVAEEYKVLRDYSFTTRQRKDDKELGATYLLAVGKNEKVIRYSEFSTCSNLSKRLPKEDNKTPHLLLEHEDLTSEERKKRRKIVSSVVQKFDAAAMANVLEEDD